jgi:hypothetical protein
MAKVVTVGILFSGKEIGGRDAGHRNRRVDAARSLLRAIPALAIYAFTTQ